ncbi:MAG: WD40 repeat domain-containing protein, partial [Chloroflexaceae bacterium]|nr:WD40 repeat domain-containing protein [Chloroflexaceae bacterium]
VDLATGQMVQTLRGFQYVVDDLAFIPGSANMLVRENGGATSVWDTASGQKLRDLGQTDAIAVAPDGRLAAAMRESTIVRWQTSDWAEMPPLPTTAAITMALAATPTLRNQTRLAFAPDSRRLLALGGTDLVVWQMDGTAVPVLLPFSGRLGKVAFAPNGATLATAGFDMRLWDLASGAVRQRQIASVPAFAFSPDGATMWLTVRGSGSNDELRVLDIASGQMRPLPQTPAPGNLAFSPAGSSVVARDDNIKQWDATTGALLREFEARPTLSGALSGVAGGSTPMFSPDGRLLAAGVDEQVRVWDAATGQELRRFVHPSSMSRVQQVLFSPDSTLVASLALDSVILREVDSGREQRQLRLSDPQRFFSSIAFSPDGTLLAAGTYLNGDPSGTSELKVWEVATGRELATFAGHTEAVFSVAFSPDGRLLASASADGTVRIVGR